MKNLVYLTTIFALSIASLSAKAQKNNFGSDSTECRKYVSLYSTSLKNKDYKDSWVSWKKVHEYCPEFSENIYVNATIILGNIIKGETDKEVKAKYGDSLMWVYDEYFKYFDGKMKDKYSTLQSLAGDLYKYRKKETQRLQDVSMEVIKAKGNKTSPSVLQYNYIASYKIHKKTAEKFTETDMIDRYIMLSDICSANTNTSYGKVQNLLDKYLIKTVKDCAQIEGIIKKNVESISDQQKKVEQAKKYLTILDKKKCEKGSLYIGLAEEIYKASATHESAFILAQLWLDQKKLSDASKYVNEAIKLCNSCDKGPEYTMAAAKIALSRRSNSSAASFARKAMNSNPKLKGDAYAIISQAIANTASTCGDNAFQHKAVYWLASDYAKKASANGSSRGGSLANKYAKQFPNKGEMFDNGTKDGETYHVGCWMNENTTSRAKAE